MGPPVPAAPGPPDELEGLLRAARGGCRVALGRLLEHYRPYLLRIANADLRDALRSKAGGSDLVQETFLEAQRVFDRFGGASPGEFQGWLRNILGYKLATHTRRFLGTAKRQAGRELPFGAPGTGPALAADQPSPSSIVNRADEAALLAQALGRLPEGYRQVILWRQWDVLSFEEIGCRLGRGADAARMLWWRAVKRLSQEMKRHGAVFGA